jgi:hypothetical protein
MNNFDYFILSLVMYSKNTALLNTNVYALEISSKIGSIRYFLIGFYKINQTFFILIFVGKTIGEQSIKTLQKKVGETSMKSSK